MDVTKKKVTQRYLSLIILVMISILTVTSSHALNKQDSSLQFRNILTSGRPVIAFGAGAAITSNFGNSQNFPAMGGTDEFFKYKTNNNNNQTNALFDVFAGGEWALNSPWSVQAGLDYKQIKSFTTTGTIIQGIDLKSADKYAYKYSLIARQLLAEGKFLYQYQNRFYPYFLIGLGVASNKAYNYSTSKPPFITFTRQYTNNTQTTFSYSAGIGIDTTIVPNVRGGIGYQITDLGKVSLGSATINTTRVSDSLVQNHLYISEVIAQLTWII